MKTEEFFNFIDDYVKAKLEKNNSYVKYTFFELKVKLNLEDNDIERFLKCSKIMLEGIGFNVYFTGEKFLYDGQEKTVQENDYMIAIK